MANNPHIKYHGPKDFVHHHCHTVLSSLDGVASAQQYADKCVEYGQSGISITEHGHMASVPDAYLAFKAAKLKYIAGCEIYYNDWEPKRHELEAAGVKVRSPEWRKDNPELAARINRNRHLTVICKNQTGFHNLIKLTTQAYSTGLFGLGKKQFNRIWFEKLCEHKEGLMILSGCLNGPVCHELRTQQLTDREGNVVFERTRKECVRDAIMYAKKFKKVFGEDYYMELQMPGIEGDVKVFKELVTIADGLGIKTAITNDSHYIKRADFRLQKIMMAIAQGTTVDSPDLFHVNSDEQFFKTRAELWETYVTKGYDVGHDDAVFERSCDNTLEIADKCKMIDIDPDPKIPAIESADNVLRRMVAKRLCELRLDKCQDKFLIDGEMVTYVQQAKRELDRLIDKGFSSYILITQDIINYGRGEGWPFGPRGSAGGSLVCYLLGIHTLDPLKFSLSFDRFLSPSRGGYSLNLNMPEPV